MRGAGGVRAWQPALAAIKRMRASRDAVVDAHGTAAIVANTPRGPSFRFETLVGLMLSSQTRDQQTDAAVRRLRARGLLEGPRALLERADEAELRALIAGVNFATRKAQFLRRCAETLLREHGGDVPATFEGFLALPGVGPKMGVLAMLIIHDQVVGICVDTHVHRIAQRLGWVTEREARSAEGVRKALEARMPREEWAELNTLLVGFGQQVCSALRPRCGACDARPHCSFYEATRGGAQREL